MITNFAMTNFKSFASSEMMRFAPITLIFGPNSSGKSSIIQALMMLKQTLEKENGQGKLETDGESISLSNYSNIIHGQNDKLPMGFDIQYTANHSAQEFKNRHSYNMPFGNDDLRTASFSYKKMNKANKHANLNTFSFNCSDRVNFSVDIGRESSEGYLYSLKPEHNLKNAIIKNKKILSDDGKSYIEIDDSLSKPFKIDSKINLPKIFSHLPYETLSSSYSDQILDDLSYILKKTKYLGPLRSSPKRFYSSEINAYQKGQGKGNLGFDLYNASNITKSKIDKYLSNFSIPYEIFAKNIGDNQTGDIISILLKDNRNDTIVTPRDVGFGIGQVLPIILEGTVSNKHLICVEQPEIHLHPRLQAHLADLFIDSAIDSQNQWIIETHSEALMLRIQRRIREKKIHQSMISVLYVDVGENGAQVTELPLDEDGDFTVHWPDGFFEERLEEIFGNTL